MLPTEGPGGRLTLASQPGPFGGMIFCMLPWSAELAGRIDEHVISSELLRDNPLGDSPDRPLLVYTPPGYDDEPGRAYPAVYVGVHRARDDVAEQDAVQAAVPGDRRRDVRTR